MFKHKLETGLWKKEGYYHTAKAASLDTKHPGILELKRLSKLSKKILDLGCGEGTKLNFLVGKNARGVGIDISALAIKLAKDQYPNLTFVKADLENLPLKANDYSLVYSTFVLEHLDNPEKVIKEAIRVTKPGGFLVFVAPNFGAPNRASPPFKGSRFLKFLRGAYFDLLNIFKTPKVLNWRKVAPLSVSGEYEIDFDATSEPYLLTLVGYLSERGLRIIKSSSCWNQELANPKFHQKVFRFLGENAVYPFVFWGPHLLVVAQKTLGRVKAAK